MQQELQSCGFAIVSARGVIHIVIKQQQNPKTSLQPSGCPASTPPSHQVLPRNSKEISSPVFPGKSLQHNGIFIWIPAWLCRHGANTYSPSSPSPRGALFVSSNIYGSARVKRADEYEQSPRRFPATDGMLDRGWGQGWGWAGLGKAAAHRMQAG